MGRLVVENFKGKFDYKIVIIKCKAEFNSVSGNEWSDVKGVQIRDRISLMLTSYS